MVQETVSGDIGFGLDSAIYGGFLGEEVEPRGSQECAAELRAGDVGRDDYRGNSGKTRLEDVLEELICQVCSS